MDHETFDAVARVFAPTTSRRKVLRWATVTGLLAALGGAKATEARHCRYTNCPCVPGTHHACVPGMVCCPVAPRTPANVGTCQFSCPVSPICSGYGCSCTTGTFAPCDAGLICCPNTPGLPGGSGVCLPEYQCG